MSTRTKSQQQAARYLARLKRTRSDHGSIRALSAILEDPILAGDIEARGLRYNAMTELLRLRGFSEEDAS